jgi:transketolase
MTIGYGAPNKAGKASAHGSPLGAEEIAGARKALHWDSPPFAIPADIRDA